MASTAEALDLQGEYPSAETAPPVGASNQTTKGLGSGVRRIVSIVPVDRHTHPRPNSPVDDHGILGGFGRFPSREHHWGD